MSIGDVYQIRMFQQTTLIPDVALNVYYYKQTAGFSGVPNAADLAGEFTDNVWDVVRSLQSDQMVTTKYTVINISDPTDYVEAFPNSAGNSALGGLTLPTFMAAAVRAPRMAAGDRYSYKRFSGIKTGAMGANLQWDDAYWPILDAVAVAHGAVLEGANGTYHPVQVAAGWSLGTTPTVNYDLAGFWQYNKYPTHQTTRQDGMYEWVTGTP